MYTLGAGRIFIKSIINVCLLNLMAWKANWAHRTGENEEKKNDEIKTRSKRRAPVVQLDLNELSSDASSGSSLISDDDVDTCEFEVPDICASCNMGPPEVTLKKCSRCQLSKYCSLQCQKDNWQEHKFACSIVASQRLSK